MTFFLILICIIIGEGISNIFFRGILEKPINGKTQDVRKENPYIIKFKPFVHSHIPDSEYIQQGKNFSVNYKINSLGLRDNEPLPRGKKFKKRLLIVGDSVTEGHGVQFHETYVYHLKKLLENDDWDVLNAGIQGAGIAHQSTNLIRYFELKPDAILFATYENDLADDRRIEIHYDQYPVLEDPSIFFPDSNFSYFFKSKLFQMGYVFFSKYIRSKTEVENIIKQNSKLIKKITTPEQLGFKSLSFLHPSIVMNAWEMTSRYYDYFKRETSQRKIPLYVANLTYLPYQPGFNSEFKKSADLFDEHLKKYLSDNNIPYFNIKETVEEFCKNNPGGIAIPDDGHPNSEGHRLFASSLYPWLKTHLQR